MNLKVTLSILIILALLFIGAIYFYLEEKEAVRNIQTFAECKENGFPVQESYPSRCMTPDGRTFTEEINVGTTDDAHANLIRLESHRPGDTVRSPVTVTGRARGYWFFEGSFPVELRDAKGTQIAIVPATAQGEWMTEEFVPFSATLTFTSTTTQTGTLVLHKDNPSGLPENDDSVSIPVILTP